MNSLIKSLFKFWDGIHPKNPYERLGKAEKAKAVRVSKGHVPIKSLFKFLDGIHHKNYERLGKAKKAKAVRVSNSGHVPMYVGKEEKLYEVPVKFLSLRSFQELLEHSQTVVDDLDIKNDGPIVLTCSTDVFDRLLREANAKIA